MANADNGVSSAGLMTAVQPTVKAAPSFLVIMAMGKFHCKKKYVNNCCILNGTKYCIALQSDNLVLKAMESRKTNILTPALLARVVEYANSAGGKIPFCPKDATCWLCVVTHDV